MCASRLLSYGVCTCASRLLSYCVYVRAGCYLMASVRVCRLLSYGVCMCVCVGCYLMASVCVRAGYCLIACMYEQVVILWRLYVCVGQQFGTEQSAKKCINLYLYVYKSIVFNPDLLSSVKE